MEHTDRDAIRGYLTQLAGAETEGLLELRFRLKNSGMAQRFYPASQPGGLVEAIQRLATRGDVYVGCAPRLRRAGGRDAIGRAWTLWVDCDTPGAVHAVAEFDPAPTMVVRSGGPHGACHAYWALGAPADAADVEAANLRLAAALGADEACFDAARILRPPGTWNHKYQPPSPVQLVVDCPDRRFTVDEVLAWVPEVQVPARVRAQPVPRTGGGDPLLQVAPDDYVRVLLGVEVPRSRKVECPFHADECPSLHIYGRPERGWYCFSCRRGGSIYDLASALWGLRTRGRDFLEIRDRLTSAFPVAAPEVTLDLPGR